MKARVEHINVTVGDIEASLAFLQAALPSFRVRGRGRASQSNGDVVLWLHFGDDDSYVALNQVIPADSSKDLDLSNRGFEHLGFAIDSVADLRARMAEAGYGEGVAYNSHPHRLRHYYTDPNGIEWEFVEYLAEAVEKRNDYQLA